MKASIQVSCAIVLLLTICRNSVIAQAAPSGTLIRLWDSGAPGFEDRKDDAEQAKDYWVKNIHHPSLTAFLPTKEKATGAAVIVCPGGGHRELVFKAEGVEAAQYLSDLGVAAFALKYRLGREDGSPYKIETHAKQDGERAMRVVRSRAKEFGIDPTRVGIMGFSAGGEVVSMVAYGAGAGEAAASDPIERESSRPDFQIMIYPGPLGIPETIPESAPPAFLLVANDDRGASRTIVDLLPKFRSAGVPIEVHVYARGGHAFNMGNRSKLKTLSTWPQRMADWMADNYLLDTTGRDEYQKQLAENRQRIERFRQRQQTGEQKKTGDASRQSKEGK